MKIDRKLNLVIPIDKQDGSTAYVHVMPVSREVFEQHFLLLGRAFNAMYAQGLGIIGPRMASLLLKKVASEMSLDNPDALVAPLLSEMRRLASVLAPRDGGGYEIVPWQTAVDKKMFDEEDTREVENVMTFFMVSWHMHKRAELSGMIEMAVGLGAQQSTSLSPTEFANSLTTSTDAATTVRKATASSIPS